METRGKVRCGKCIYRAPDNAGYLCDYLTITGHSRGGEPISGCGYFTPGEVSPEKKRADWNAEHRKKQQEKAPKKKVPRYDWSGVRAMYDRGMSDYMIAKTLGCSHTTVMNWRRREGLPVNERPEGGEG